MYLWPFVCFLLDNDLTEEERTTGLFLGASHGLMCVLSFWSYFLFLQVRLRYLEEKFLYWNKLTFLFQNLKTSNFLDWLCISPKTLRVTVNIKLWLINYPPCY